VILKFNKTRSGIRTDKTLQENKEKKYKLNSSTRIITYLVLEIALDQYLHNDSYA
jgi:hypothetical protein